MTYNISDYLHYRYEPTFSSGLPSNLLNSLGERDFDSTPYGDLLVEGQRAFEAAIATVVTSTSADRHILPISSGFDSRLILCGLLNHPDIDNSNIETVTVGTPGTWDFEIGRRVAEAAGVSHTPIDLTSDDFDWTVSSIEAAPIFGEPTPMLDKYIHALIAAVGGPDTVYWSGFIGGELAGAHFPATPSDSWDEALDWFADWQQTSKRLTRPDHDPTASLPDEPYVSPSLLTYEEQLDFAVRQQCYIAPVVLRNDRYQTPFMQSAWLEFMLNVPREYRRDQRLYKDICQSAYPELFSLPLDTNYGFPLNTHQYRKSIRGIRFRLTEVACSVLGRPSTHPSTNYVDFGHRFRAESDLKDTARTLISRLADRDDLEWVPATEIWTDHQNGEDYTKEIRALCSLELHLEDDYNEWVDVQPKLQIKPK